MLRFQGETPRKSWDSNLSSLAATAKSSRSSGPPSPAFPSGAETEELLLLRCKSKQLGGFPSQEQPPVEDTGLQTQSTEYFSRGTSPEVWRTPSLPGGVGGVYSSSELPCQQGVNYIVFTVCNP